MKRFGTFALAACLLAASSAPAQAGADADKARASALTREGARAYQAGDYATALTRFQEAYAVFPSPRLLFNLGQSFGRAGRYVEATESFERFLASAGSAPASARGEAERSLDQMRDRVAHIEVAANVTAAEVSIDGQSRGLTPLARPVLVAPGPHQVTVQKAGAERFQRQVQVVGGTIARVDVELHFPTLAPPPQPAAAMPTGVVLAQPPPPPPPPPGWTWSQRIGVSLMVAGPAAMAGGLYYGKRAKDRAGEIATYCSQGCAGQDILASDRTRRHDGLNQWILLGTGAAATATGVALFFLGGADAASVETRVSLELRPGGLSARLARRF